MLNPSLLKISFDTFANAISPSHHQSLLECVRKFPTAVGEDGPINPKMDGQPRVDDMAEQCSAPSSKSDESLGIRCEKGKKIYAHQHY